QYFDPTNSGMQVIPLTRSQYVGGTNPGHPRQQVNTITAWIDGSQIYGSDSVTADKLRTHVGGRLKSSPGPDSMTGTEDDMLPYTNRATFPTGILPMANGAGIVPDDELFAAGDVRANENIELTCLHTLFLREHNRIADQIHASQPGLSDETVYQM